MALTPAVVRYAFSGVSRDAAGQIHRTNHVFAKISRPEVAQHFMAPPPQAILDALVQAGDLTAEEAALARHLPVAEDITVESDSGGHTDNRPLGSLFPTIAQLRDELMARYGYTRPIRVGAAGGLGTPESVASAFALGAAYVLTGSVNQSCREAGVSDDAKAMLALAELADMTMAPSADMFELGVKVQVLKRGTMFASRASTLYSLYTRFPSLDAIPADELARIEQQLFRQPVGEVWDDARKFFEVRGPHEIERAERDPKHKMALVFRSYLGRSSRWPIDGDSDRRLDYQIWCGPAMGAFNAWVKGSFLEKPENRTVVQVARNLLGRRSLRHSRRTTAQLRRARPCRCICLPAATIAVESGLSDLCVAAASAAASTCKRSHLAIFRTGDSAGRNSRYVCPFHKDQELINE